MAKDKKSVFPGSMRDHEDAVKADAEKVGTKIDESFQKLAKKMRGHADKAKSKVDTTKKPEKRAVQLRRFELYADAATHLEERFSRRDD